MLPTYDQLPIDKQYPPKTAWGLWGKDDNYGTLNLLTEERVLNASKSVKRGVTFALNWKLEQPGTPFFERSSINHEYKQLHPANLAFDDIYHNFNTQSSSQWDGLRHVAHIPSGLFYNGVEPEHVAKGSSVPNGRLGIHHAARRGIAGRAVLLDYGAWAEKHNPSFDPLERIEITVQELDEVAKAQGVTFEEGDILLLRTGWIKAYEKNPKQITNLLSPSSAGVKACEDTYRWLWNHHFAAVASDAIAFEAFPVHDWENSCRK
ncbi:putative cyclase-domain-containing protein [Blakeslea trispora]|nr:putative cyclase-domain-containing protein [Blakeslea trispora]